MKRLLLIFLALTSSSFLVAQQENLLTIDAFLDFVRKNHPIAKQADLVVTQAEARRLSALGNFDPSVSFGSARKEFKDQTYYNYSDADLKIPVWAGIDLEASYMLADGDFLNPQLVVPNTGLYSVGISIPVARGLVMDNRRAAVKEARVLEAQSADDRLNRLNDLIFRAANVYWDWVLAYEQVKVFERAVETARIRFDAVKRSYMTGQLPAVDTLESFIQYQNRMFSLNDAKLAFEQAGIELSTHLWAENGLPLLLAPDVAPAERLSEEFPLALRPESYWIDLVGDHPRLRMIRQFRRLLGVRKQLAVNNLLPEVNLQYRFLSETSPWMEAGFSANPNDYTFGVKASIPLFMRRPRGDLKLVNAQIAFNTVETDFLLIDLENNVRQQFRAVETAAIQAVLSKEVMVNSAALFNFEVRKFGVGESTLFLINARELAAIDAEVQFLRTQNRLLKADARLVWAAGVWGN
jgi:outer membrane protein TolC